MRTFGHDLLHKWKGVISSFIVFCTRWISSASSSRCFFRYCRYELLCREAGRGCFRVTMQTSLLCLIICLLCIYHLCFCIHKNTCSSNANKFPVFNSWTLWERGKDFERTKAFVTSSGAGWLHCVGTSLTTAV